jgi:hypothetical protein
MAATDDLVRTWYHLSYEFLDDVSYDRLAFFQVAADNYSDNGFTRYAAGNDAEILLEEDVPDHGATGYASASDRGIELPGNAPWVMLYASDKADGNLPELHADVGFVVRSFEANIGGTQLTTPHVNVHRTKNQGISQMAFELGLPHEDGSPWCGAPCGGETRFVPAGSTVEATVEYLVPPADKSRYYGSAPYLVAMQEEDYSTPEMMIELAGGNDVSVTATVGTVERALPVEVAAVPGIVSADLTISGGRGFTPVTFLGLNRADGWALEVETDTGWESIDQSVHGNDFWQTNYDPGTATWSVTYTLANSGTQRYRLVWAAP